MQMVLAKPVQISTVLQGQKASWRLLFLSAGEISIGEHLQQVGKKVRAGQEIRIIDIPADTGKFGIFEHLHGFESGDAFSKHLCKVSKEHYGLAAREFLKCIVREKEDVLVSSQRAHDITTKPISS